MTGTLTPAADSIRADRNRRRWLAAILAVALLAGGYAVFVATQSPIRIIAMQVDGVNVTADEHGYAVGYDPGGQVILRVFLENGGLFPVRLDGVVLPLVPDSTPDSLSVGPFSKGEPQLFEDNVRQPFRPVDIAAGGAASVGLVLTMCPLGTPGYDQGSMWTESMWLSYRYAGWERTHTVSLGQRFSGPLYRCRPDGTHF